MNKELSNVVLRGWGPFKVKICLISTWNSPNHLLCLCFENFMKGTTLFQKQYFRLASTYSFENPWLYWEISRNPQKYQNLAPVFS